MKIEKYITSRSIIFLSLFVLVLRLIFVFVYNDFHKMEDYLLAENIVSGDGYAIYDHLGPTAMKTPVYPYFLSVLIFLFNSVSLYAVAIIQHILYCLVPYILFKIGEVNGYKKAGFFAGVIAALYPTYFYYPNVIETTNLFIPFSAFWLFLFFKIRSKNKALTVLLFGALSAVTALLQPVSLPVIVTGMIYLFIKNKRRFFFRYFALIIILFSAWGIRNYIVFNQMILTKSPFWMNIYLGYIPENTDYDTGRLLSQKSITKIDSLKNVKNDVQMEKEYKIIVLSLWEKSFSSYLGKTFSQMISYWWITPRYSNDNSLKFFLIRKFPLAVLCLLTIIGLYLMYKENKKNFFSLILILFYFTIIYSFTSIANIRYKLDVEWLQFFPSGIVLAKLFWKRSSD